MIEQFRQENNLKIEYSYLMEIDQLTLQKRVSELNNSLSKEDIDIHQLSLIDAEIINNSWSYKSEDTLEQIKYQIEHFPTIGAYRNGKLLSWYLLKYDGSLGMAYTIEEARRQGLSSILNLKLAEKVFQIQDHVFCGVIQNNQSSIDLLTKIGYQQMSDEYWIFP
jgi:8-oxo-dGTP diphosphatase